MQRETDVRKIEPKENSNKNEQSWLNDLSSRLKVDKQELSKSSVYLARKQIPKANQEHILSCFEEDFKALSRRNILSEAPIGDFALFNKYVGKYEPKNVGPRKTSELSSSASSRAASPISRLFSPILFKTVLPIQPVISKDADESEFTLVFEAEEVVKENSAEEKSNKLIEVVPKEAKVTREVETKEEAKKKKFRRVGDWKCKTCRNINFSFRNTCNKCKGEKSKNIVPHFTE